MLTTNKAAAVVRFVYEALEKPNNIVKHEEMGGIHAILAPHLRKWSQDRGKRVRPIVLVSAVGSVNYDVVVESSDLDMKAVYMPSLEDLYYGKYSKFSLTTDEFDCELHPAQQFCQHVLKGNINFFEPLYADAVLARPDFAFIMGIHLKPLVEMNVIMTAMSCFFTALQQNKNAGGTNNWNPKKASHAIRILAFLTELLDTGKFNIVTPEPFRDAVLRLKRNEMDRSEYIGLFDELHTTVKGMMFKHFNSGSDCELTDRVIELDGTKTPAWNELRTDLDVELMALIRRPIEKCAAEKAVMFHRKS